jgi:hypothetical protein
VISRGSSRVFPGTHDAKRFKGFEQSIKNNNACPKETKPQDCFQENCDQKHKKEYCRWQEEGRESRGY